MPLPLDKQVSRVSIDLRDRTIVCYNVNGHILNWPLSRYGGHIKKFAKNSAGGLMIQAVFKQLDNARSGYEGL